MLARNKESLAAEMDNASKDEVTITPVFQSPYTYTLYMYRPKDFMYVLYYTCTVTVSNK